MSGTTLIVLNKEQHITQNSKKWFKLTVQDDTGNEFTADVWDNELLAIRNASKNVKRAEIDGIECPVIKCRIVTSEYVTKSGSTGINTKLKPPVTKAW